MNDKVIEMPIHATTSSTRALELEHIKHIPAFLENSRQIHLLCDVKIMYRGVVGWCSMLCHRSVLAAALPLLWQVLVDIEEEEVVIITEMNKQELNVFLKFIYTGEAAVGDDNNLKALGKNLTAFGFLEGDEFSYVENIGWQVKHLGKVTLYVTEYEDHTAVRNVKIKHTKVNNDLEDHTICVNVDDQGNFSMEENDLDTNKTSQNYNNKSSKKIMQINLGVQQQDVDNDKIHLMESHYDIDVIKSYKTTSIETTQDDTNILYLGVHPNSKSETNFTKNSFVKSKLEELKVAYAPRKKNFKCVECGDRFSTEVKLTTHEADVHLALECRVCRKILKGNKLLIDHASLHNKQEHKEDIPSSNNKNKPPQSDLNRKRPIKKMDERPTCDICSEKFVTKQALRFHEYKHSGIRPYVCKVCPTSFRTPSTLRAHFDVMHSHSKHKCDECGLQSSTSGKLKIHMRTHSDEKPYQCSFCPSRFKQLQVLKIHEFTHTKESKYKCDKCGKYFPSKSRLIKHKTQPVCKSRPRTQKPIHLSQPELILVQSSPIYKLSRSSIREFEKDLTQTSNMTTVINKYDNDEDELNKPSDISGEEVLNANDIPVLVDELPVIESDTGTFNFFENKN